MSESFELISESICPSCGMELDSALSLENDPRKPHVGSVAVCANCAFLSVYSDKNAKGKLILTEPSDELLKELRSDKDCWSHIISIKAGIYASIIDGTNPLSRGKEKITNPADFLTIDTQITPEDNMMHEITHRIESGKDKFGTLTIEEIQSKYADDPNWFCIVTMIKPPRIGANLFIVSLEYNHFKPGTDRNKDFQFMFIKWQDMIYAMVTIPYKDKDIAYRVAEEVDMRISDGIPEVFPVHSPRVFSLENSKNSPVYGSSQENLKKLEEEEDAKVEDIFTAHEKWLKDHPEITEYK